MKKKIWLSAPYWSGREEQYIQAAVRDNWIAPGGPNVLELEKRVAEQAGRKYCKVVNSGTSALHLSLLAFGIGPGNTVFCPGFTFAAVINPVIYTGATPVLIDCLPGTWNMDPDLLEEAIEDLTKNPPHDDPPQKGKNCLICVHNYGMPADMDRLEKISAKYEMILIEDASEAMGSRAGGLMAGGFGIASIFSFNGNKIVTASTGGAELSDQRIIVDRVEYLAGQARDRDKPYYHSAEVGYNYQLSNINAGIALGQLETLAERVERKRQIAAFYRKHLEDIPGISFQEEPAGVVSNHWLSCILIDPVKTGGVDRDNVYRALMAENIESRYVWKPLHLQPAYSRFRHFGRGVAESMFSQGLCLPSGAGLTEEDLERITEVVIVELKKMN